MARGPVSLKAVGAAALTLLFGLGPATPSSAEVERGGNAVVNFDGGIAPYSLPRNGTAPVAVTIESSFRAADGTDPPPQLQQIAIAINREGRIFDRGLPTCKVRRIQPATIRAARRICGGAIVGKGSVQVRVNLENQEPFTFKGPLLAFNAERHRGKRRILAQVYGTRPPSAFVLTFTIHRQRGTFGTVIRTTLPRSARKWAHVTRFNLRLRRTYTFRGKRRSYVNAGCAAPAGFPGAVYPFARANFAFAGGNRIVSTLVRDCRVR